MIDLPCPAEDWPRFSALLDAAMDQPEVNRTAWLNGLAGDDARLRPWLESLFGQAPNPDTDDILCPPLPEDSWYSAGAQVGPYRLESLLGKGGMGEVWRASRDEDGPHREVALKLPYPMFIAGAFLDRFRRERDLLASLSHPAIGQLYDAGTDAKGCPYLVLELVAGAPITDFCRAGQLALEARIDLVCQILAGLSHAHQRLIVHRDIKPGNVLVTSAGQVKLLDFGIAKLLRPESANEAALTQATRLATPAYAAPEQLSGGDITVATDLFAVGVLLFELCTGHRPFARVPDSEDAAAAPLASHRADPARIGVAATRSVGRQLRGDLDAMIATALALRPSDRYSSAEAFDADLRRWRNGLPVRARRISWALRTRKFVRRNRLGVMLAAILAFSVAGGTVGTAWQAQRAERQADRAEQQAGLAKQQAKRATAIKDFLIGLFEAGNPHGGGQRSDTMTARQLLDIGADRADAAFAGDPTTEIDFLQTLGQIYDALDATARAERIRTRRLDLERRLFGPADPRVVNGTIDLAATYAEELEYDQAKAVLEQVRPAILHSYGRQDPLWATWLSNRARALRATHGAGAEIVADTREAIEIFAVHPPAKEDVADYINAFAILSYQQLDADDYAGALATLRRMRAVVTANHAGDAMTNLEYLNLVARPVERSGRLVAADALLAAAQSGAERLVGPQSEWYLSPLLARATLADMRGDRAKAAAFFKDVAATGNGLVGRVIAASLVRNGRGAEAVTLLEPALAHARQRTRDEDTVRVIEGLLGDAYDQAGRTAEAATMLSASRDEWVRYGNAGATATLAAQERWGRFLLEHGEPATAAKELRAVLEMSAKAASAPAALAAAGLARLALLAGDQSQADLHAARALQLLLGIGQEYDVRIRIDIWLTMAETLLAHGDAWTARGWVRDALTAADGEVAPGSSRWLRAHDVASRVDKAVDGLSEPSSHTGEHMLMTQAPHDR